MENGHCAYYAGIIEEFLDDSQSVEELTELLVSTDTAIRQDRLTNEEQARAWKSEIEFLRKFLDLEQLSKATIALEVDTGGSGGRADVILCGREENKRPHIILLELKTWHTQRRSTRRYEIRPYHDADGKMLFVNLYTYQSEPVFAQVSSSLERDPRRQVNLYRENLVHALTRRFPGKSLQRVVESGVVLYNCAKLNEDFRIALNYVTPPDDPVAIDTPLYTVKEENGSSSLEALHEQLISKLQGGDGEGVYQKVVEALTK